MDVYGLIGRPVEHSLSPPMHEAAYAARSLDARYVTLEPQPERIDEAIAGADALGVAGLNVTVPFKQDVLPALDPTPTAEAVGAVNTITFDGGTPEGHNTDTEGVIRAFEHHDVAVEDQSAVVVGAGGAGRAATYALADAGADTFVANRTVERAATLADEFADLGVEAGGLDDLDERLPGADLLVNATSVGMDDPDASPVPAALLHGDLAVLDAVYSPLRTRLLRDAADAGATTVDGAWMLLYQGVAAFERWTGVDAPVAAMNAALRDRL
ncbi:MULTISPECIES: shikimate dehydrogenase [Halolamina]|uniref:Shikimate dehydrogenase (NADP(+)) n=1 Tax=Halolamina pelagica TaxID=699431 RepID=A0A1I5R2N8_9EURY|nr:MULTISPECIES: shikimate dehydrogenase [Halolamina]NHX35661.1 shikimate dehydrogenase [Halolamina sp. R1-12]SFP52772.1 shikimate dehydrogenase [Halolamina pelagica]